MDFHCSVVLRLKNLFESHAYCSVLHALLDFRQQSLVAQEKGDILGIYIFNLPGFRKICGTIGTSGTCGTR